MRQAVIRVVTFLGGLYFFLRFVLPAEVGGFEFAGYNQEITNGFRAIGALTFGLGLINILLVHGTKVAFRRKGWVTSSALLAGLVLMLSVTLWEWRTSASTAAQADRLVMLREFALRIESDDQAGTAPLPTLERKSLLRAEAEKEVRRIEQELSVPGDSLASDLLRGLRNELRERIDGVLPLLNSDPTNLSLPQLAQSLGDTAAAYRAVRIEENSDSLASKAYLFLSEGLFMALGTAMFSLLAFYIASAAYRAFRIRSAESGLMMAAALVVMLGQIPFGLWLWDGFPELRMWLMTTPSTAARRAIEIGAAIAGLIMAFRMWFSIESESFGRGGAQ